MPSVFKKLPQTRYGDWDRSWEPDELRELKRDLANLKCDCPAYKRSQCRTAFASIATQTNQNSNISDTLVQPAPESVFEEVIRLQNSENQRCIDLVCPRCMVTMNILRSGITKVVKDEEVETKTTLTFDKSTGRAFPNPDISNFLESDGSIFDRRSSAFKSTYSNFPFKDFTDLMSQSSVTSQSFHKQRSREKVTFLDEYERNRDEITLKTNDTQCTWLENLINSIRPPLIGF